jgi:hypothetical protein
VFMMGEGCLWLFTAERENFGVQIWTDLKGESEKKKKKTKQNKTKKQKSLDEVKTNLVVLDTNVFEQEHLWIKSEQIYLMCCSGLDIWNKIK